MDHSRPRPRAHVLPRLFPPWVHQGRAWLDPQWPVASQTSTATTQPPSTPWVIKASLGTACAQLHVLLAAHTRIECVRILYHTTSNFCHVHTSIQIQQHSQAWLIPYVQQGHCFSLGTPLQCLTLTQKGGQILYVCQRLCAYVCRRPLQNTSFIEPAVYTTQQIMTVHVCEQVQIKCVLMKRMYEHTPGMHLYCQNQGARDAWYISGP